MSTYTGADVGPTKAMRGFLDKYGGFKTIGLNKFGEVAFDPEFATKRGKHDYANSVDISGYGLYEHLGLPYPAGVTEGSNELKVDMQRKNGVVVDRNRDDVPVEGIWLKMYEDAEKKYTPYEG